MSENRPRLVVIAGPTASGKTSTGIDLAESLGGEIVSADSIQIYRYLNIGSAKPSLEERTRVAHHMIDIRNPDEDFTAGDYVREARACINEILERRRIPLVVGGTGLYIRLLLGGIVDLPPADTELRSRLEADEEHGGQGTLHKRLVQVDPEAARKIRPENTYRVIRALEVFEKTGQRISEIQGQHALRDRLYTSLFICLAPPRKVLYELIDNRVDNMVNEGLLEEVSDLYLRGYSRTLKPLQSLGYRHAGMVLSGEVDLPEAIRLMKRDTRRYSKRQLTWFGSEPKVQWFDPDEIGQIKSVVDGFLGR